MEQPNRTQRKDILSKLSMLTIEQGATLGSCAESDIEQLIREKQLSMFLQIDSLETYCGNDRGEADMPAIAFEYGVVPVHFASRERLLAACTPSDAVRRVGVKDDQAFFVENGDSGFLRSDIRVSRSELYEVLNLRTPPPTTSSARPPRGQLKVPPALEVLTIEQASSVLGCTEVDIENLLRFGPLPPYVIIDARNDVVRSFENERSVAATPESGFSLGIVEITREELGHILDGRRVGMESHSGGRCSDTVDLAGGGVYLHSYDRIFDRGTIRVLRVHVNQTAEMRVLDAADIGEKRLRSSSVHRERCQAVAATLWKQPATRELTIEDMIDRPEITDFGQQGSPYTRDTIRNWIKEVAPPERRKPGRPRKVKPPGNA